jgi:hypothetical protein
MKPQNDEPNPRNNFLAAQAEELISSFLRITGKSLIDATGNGSHIYQALYDAPFCVMSHNTDDDPIFNYANKAAQAAFEMNWNEFTLLPSRLSAEASTQEERERLLARVTQYNFIDDYKGVRISSTGKRFLIEEAIVWNIKDENERYYGQAAVLYTYSSLA